MLEAVSPLTQLKNALASGDTTPVAVASEAARHANANALHNTYIRFDEADLIQQAETLLTTYPDPAARPPLFSVPISLKDCFDLAGTRTTCGTHFYAEHHAPAAHDSAMAARLRAAGALITGKTHLHPLAYGITGQNPDFGDCLQPRDATLLTGGSSSGAVASVQEGSALAAIGTDTGGSVRVPAALCGLVGYRASHSLASPSGTWPDAWEGAAHLAPSFDTVGFFVHDPRDAASIATTLFGIPPASAPTMPSIGCVPPTFTEDCAPEVLAAFVAWRRQLTASGAQLTEFDAPAWHGIQDIFAGIQAHEAATLHLGHYEEFEPTIAQRLRWGASLTPADLDALQQRLVDFRAGIAQLFDAYDFLMLPSAPLSRLVASEDQSSARQRILRYTAPFSLAGLPALTLPGEIIATPFGTGVQIAAAPGRDGPLLAFAAALGEIIAPNAIS